MNILSRLLLKKTINLASVIYVPYLYTIINSCQVPLFKKSYHCALAMGLWINTNSSTVPFSQSNDQQG